MRSTLLFLYCVRNAPEKAHHRCLPAELAQSVDADPQVLRLERRERIAHERHALEWDLDKGRGAF